ncbi:MAG: response regulator [Xenococcaceae cyanobacterium]
MTHLSSSTTEKENQPPLFLEELECLVERESDGCFQVVSNSVIYFIYVAQGKLFYATNSLAPFERLERHLRRLSNQNSKLTNEVIKQGRLKFRNDLEQYVQIPSDYLSIIWLLEAQYISQQEAVTLIRRLTREVFESLLNLTDIATKKFIQRENYDLIILLKLDPTVFFQQCQKRIQTWISSTPEIFSSYQRLYLATQVTNNLPNLNSEQNETICKLLKGLNFRQISALIDKDELIVAKLLYPSIVNKIIILRPPKSPFDQLPTIPANNSGDKIKDWEIEESKIYSYCEKPTDSLEKRWTIACVDNQLDTQQQLTTFLENRDLFSLIIIQKSLSAFVELLEIKPQLIFLNIDLPDINGYELCSLLRSHQEFKNIPIIMVSNHQSLINLTKSKLMGATNYLVKPFTKSELFNIVYRYLT